MSIDKSRNRRHVRGSLARIRDYRVRLVLELISSVDRRERLSGLMEHSDQERIQRGGANLRPPP